MILTLYTFFPKRIHRILFYMRALYHTILLLHGLPCRVLNICRVSDDCPIGKYAKHDMTWETLVYHQFRNSSANTTTTSQQLPNPHRYPPKHSRPQQPQTQQCRHSTTELHYNLTHGKSFAIPKPTHHRHDPAGASLSTYLYHGATSVEPHCGSRYHPRPYRNPSSNHSS